MQNIASDLLAQSLSTASWFALLPDTQKICDESLMRPFWVLAPSHMCHSHGPEGRCRACGRVIRPRIQLLSPSLRAVTRGSPLIHLPKTCDNQRVRREWYCMVNPDLYLSENRSWLFLFKTLHSQSLLLTEKQENQENHEGYIISLPRSLSN